MSARLFRCALLVGMMLGWGASARAATPHLDRILPRGVQRGTEADLTVQGSRLADAQELVIYSPGVTVMSVQVVRPEELKVHVRVDANAPVGEYNCRVRSETGISELRTFQVTPFKVIDLHDIMKTDAKGRPINTFENPQPIDLNVTVAGSLPSEQVQYFAVDMKKGQRLTAEVQGMRLGELFDPFLAILDQKRFELSVSDDTAFAMQDPIASTIIPADGRYIIALRESSYREGAHYLLHVGSFPRPTILYPLGGRPGEELHVKFLGDVGGPLERTLKLPGEPNESLPIFPEQDGLIAPTPNHVRVSDMPNVLEQEPNDETSQATPYEGDLPVAFNGIIEKAGDVDFFRFKARRGQALDLRVYARQLRSPLDSVLTLYNAKGNVISSNDDNGGPDSYIRFNVGEDGVYFISVTDQLKQGGPDYAYRVEISEPRPAVVMAIPQFNNNSQERWTIPVPRGNRYATLVRATRINTGGDVTIKSMDLPPGVTAVSADGSSGEIPVVFEARADAPIGGKLCTLGGDVFNGDKKVDVVPRYQQQIDLVYGNNNSPLYKTDVQSLAVAVTKEAPFKLHLEQPKAPLVLGGEISLKVTAERAPDFKNPISVRFLYMPPNLGGLSTIDMPGDKSELLFPINAQTNATPGKTWKVCVAGMSDVNGELWVASEFVDLTIAEPFIDGSLNMTAAEQGKSTMALCKLDQKRPFAGKAVAKLMGLPANVTAEDVQITSADTQVMFPVTVGEKASPGRRDSLFCRVTIIQDGEEIVHQFARGGVLRVDKPEVPKTASPTPAVAQGSKPAKPAAPAGEKVLSRLEKLRLEQGQK